MNLHPPSRQFRLNRVCRYLTLMAVALLFAGCAVTGPKATTTLQDALAQENSASHQQTKQLNAQLFASASTAMNMKDYVIREGDLLQVNVYEDQDLNTTARVSARGTVTLPLLGDVKVGGMTTGAAEQKIAAAYGAKYYQDPHVNVFVKEQQGGRITVLGAVQKPGTFEYYTPQRLLAVLAMAGGLADQAGSEVQVRRPGKDPNHPQLFVIDLEQLVKQGHAELNMPIQGGDSIYVPQAGMVYVAGAVRKPGNYPIKQAMSVGEAIVAAGGFSSIASQDDVKLVHVVNGKREVVKLSGQGVNGGEGNLNVHDGDIVFVGSSKFRAALYGLHINVLGLGGFGYSPPAQ